MLKYHNLFANNTTQLLGPCILQRKRNQKNFFFRKSNIFDTLKINLKTTFIK